MYVPSRGHERWITMSFFQTLRYFSEGAAGQVIHGNGRNLDTILALDDVVRQPQACENTHTIWRKFEDGTCKERRACWTRLENSHLDREAGQEECRSRLVKEESS
jgi:hypothetical protein